MGTIVDMRQSAAIVVFICGCVAACGSESSPVPAPENDAGASVVAPPPVVVPPPAEAGAACVDFGGDCKGAENSCCNGTTCVFDPADPSKAVCATNCLSGDQCNTGCCTVLIAGTAAVCAPTRYCAGSCVQPGEACDVGTCCPNAVCVGSTVTGISCAARCINHSQCVSGCCAPLNNTGELVCSPQTFCL